MNELARKVLLTSTSFQVLLVLKYNTPVLNDSSCKHQLPDDSAILGANQLVRHYYSYSARHQVITVVLYSISFAFLDASVFSFVLERRQGDHHAPHCRWPGRRKQSAKSTQDGLCVQSPDCEHAREQRTRTRASSSPILARVNRAKESINHPFHDFIPANKNGIWPGMDKCVQALSLLGGSRRHHPHPPPNPIRNGWSGRGREPAATVAPATHTADKATCLSSSSCDDLTRELLPFFNWTRQGRIISRAIPPWREFFERVKRVREFGVCVMRLGEQRRATFTYLLSEKGKSYPRLQTSAPTI